MQKIKKIEDKEDIEVFYDNCNNLKYQAEEEVAKHIPEFEGTFNIS